MTNGVDNIQDNGLKICVDWLSWTFPEYSNPQPVVEFMAIPWRTSKRFPRGEWLSLTTSSFRLSHINSI